MLFILGHEHGAGSAYAGIHNRKEDAVFREIPTAVLEYKLGLPNAMRHNFMRKINELDLWCMTEEGTFHLANIGVKVTKVCEQNNDRTHFDILGLKTQKCPEPGKRLTVPRETV